MSKKTQIIRGIVQLIFLVLLIIGVYTKFRKIFIVMLPLSLMTGNFFCGWICPYGSVQEFFGAIGNKIFKRKCKMPQSIQKYLQFSRYLLMVLTVVGIGGVFFEDINSYKVFMQTGTDLSSVIFSASVVIMTSFILISMLFERPFCNYLCIEATKFGVASLTRIFTIKRNEGSCVKCKRCDRVCPMNIPVSNGKNLRSAQCINCFQCISTCPAKGTLSYGKVNIFLKKDSK